MRSYELMILLDPNLQEEESSSLTEKIQKTITSNHGRTIKVSPWGKRKLAYELKGLLEANYVVIDFELEPENIAKLERTLKLNEKIVRYLIVLGKEVVMPQKEKK